MKRAVESFERDAKSEDVVAALRRDGGVVVREQVETGVVDAVMAELREHFDTVGRRFEGEFNGYKTLRLPTILARSRTSAGYPKR